MKHHLLVGPSAPSSQAAARSILDSDMFGEAFVGDPVAATSRRKRAQDSSTQQRQQDKYAAEKGVVVGDLEQLEDSTHLDVSRQVLVSITGFKV